MTTDPRIEEINRRWLGTPIYEDIGFLLAQLEAHREALEEIEWQSHGHFCYVCTAEKCKGHFPDCPIGKVLQSPPLP